MIDQTIRVFPREIEAATRWAFRAAKIPAGYGVAATALVRQAEVEQGLGLSVLHHYLSDTNRPPPVPAGLISNEPPQIMIDALNQHLLICGPNIMDLACAQAITQDQALIQVQNVGQGLVILPYLADTAATRDLLCAIVTPNEMMIAVPQTLWPLRVSVTQTPTESGFSQLAYLFEQWGILTGQVSNQLRQALTSENGDPAPSVTRVMIFCRRLDQADKLRISADKWLSSLAPAQGLAIVHPHTRLKQQHLATKKGVAVQAATWQAIKQFGSRILIPTTVSPTQKNIYSTRRPAAFPGIFKW